MFASGSLTDMPKHNVSFLGDNTNIKTTTAKFISSKINANISYVEIEKSKPFVLLFERQRDEKTDRKRTSLPQDAQNICYGGPSSSS